jgi:hypothetical protein
MSEVVNRKKGVLAPPPTNGTSHWIFGQAGSTVVIPSLLCFSFLWGANQQAVYSNINSQARSAS